MSSLPYDALMGVQQGTMAYTYRGRSLLKNPFDLALYPLLLQRLRPATIVEVGSFEGGSAWWFADQATTLGLDTTVVSVDLEPPAPVPHPAVRFVRGDGRALGDALTPAVLATLPHPWLVVEDADHQATTTRAVLDFFDPLLEVGDYVAVEDGILTAMRVADSYDGGPLRAVHEFLAERGASYAVDRDLCDFFGPNVTWNVDGFLQRVRP